MIIAIFIIYETITITKGSVILLSKNLKCLLKHVHTLSSNINPFICRQFHLQIFWMHPLKFYNINRLKAHTWPVIDGATSCWRNAKSKPSATSVAEVSAAYDFQR